MSKYSGELREQLGENKIKECLDSLIISLVKTERKLYDDCILLKARYVNAKGDDLRGFPDKEEINKIRASLTEIINEVEKKDINEIEISKIGLIKKRHLLYVGLLVALGSLFIAYSYFRNTIQEGECYEPRTRTEYLKMQLDCEKEATHVFYITKGITNVIATNKYLEYIFENRLKTDKIFSKEATFIYEVMKDRKNNFEKRISNKEISFATVIFSEEEIIKDTSEVAISRVKYVLEFAKNNPQVRLIMVKRDYMEDHFFNDNTGLALICTNKNTSIVLARQATTGQTPIEPKVPNSEGIANDRICKDRGLSEAILIEVTELMSLYSSDETEKKLNSFVERHRI